YDHIASHSLSLLAICAVVFLFIFFFFTDPPTTEIYTLSLPTLFRSAISGLTDSVSHGSSSWRIRFLRNFGSWLDGSSTHSSPARSEEHTSELQSRGHLVCRLLLEKKKNNTLHISSTPHEVIQ